MLIGKLHQAKNPYSGRREYRWSLVPSDDSATNPLHRVSGMGNWPAAYPAYATFDGESFSPSQAHNDWAQWAVEGGLPFAILMLSVAVWTFPPSASRGLRGLGAVAVFAHCLVDYPIQRIGVALVMFSLIAALAYPDERADIHEARAEPGLIGGQRIGAETITDLSNVRLRNVGRSRIALCLPGWFPEPGELVNSGYLLNLPITLLADKEVYGGS